MSRTNGRPAPAPVEPETDADFDYSSTQQKILLHSQLICELDLEQFIDRIETSEAVAPLFDPTLYMRAADNLQAIKELAVALRRFQKVALDVRDRAKAKAGR